MNVDVTTRGTVEAQAVAAAHEKVGRLDRLVKGPILGARVVLIQEPNPRIPRPSRAEGEIDLAGNPVRGRVAAATMPAAVDELAEHLQRRLRDFVDRLKTREQRGSAAPAGEWFHRSWAPPRPDYFPRPAAEREIVRRKTFTVGAQTVAEAAADMAALDHDFLLFRDADADADAVLHRRDGDGRLEVIAPPGVAPTVPADDVAWRASRFSDPVDVATARAEMDTLDRRFLFFVNRDTGRGNVLYLRYDGHYGLLEPAG